MQQQEDQESKQYSNELRMDHDDSLKKLNMQSLEDLKHSNVACLEGDVLEILLPSDNHHHEEDIKLQIIKGSIVDLPIYVDAIVNAANETLMGGGGIDQIIHAKAGIGLKLECKTKYSPSCMSRKGDSSNEEWEYRCSTGEAVITHSHELSEKCQYIIHTVGPYLDENGNTQPQLLSNCYKSCIDIATENQLKSIAFPCISTGYYGFPFEEACRVALTTVKDHLYQTRHQSLKHIIFVIFNDLEFDIYKILFKQLNKS